MGTRFLPNRAKTSSKTVFDDLKKALFGFVRAQATLVSITTVIILIGLLILRVDYAITIALVTGIVDIIHISVPVLSLSRGSSMKQLPVR